MSFKTGYIILILALFSCSEEQKIVAAIEADITISEKPKEAAIELCNCLKKGELTKVQNWMNSFDNPSALSDNYKSLEDCVRSVVEANKDYINSLSLEDQKAYVKEFLHAFIESDCVDEVLSSLPDTMMDQILKY
jgi:hypothetical protein